MWLVEVCSWDVLPPPPGHSLQADDIFPHRHWTINRKPFKCHFTGSSLVREEYCKTFTAALVGITTSNCKYSYQGAKVQIESMTKVDGISTSKLSVFLWTGQGCHHPRGLGLILFLVNIMSKKLWVSMKSLPSYHFVYYLDLSHCVEVSCCCC